MTFAQVLSPVMSEGSLALWGVWTALLSMDCLTSFPCLSFQLIWLHNHLLKAFRVAVTVTEFPFPSGIRMFSSDGQLLSLVWPWHGQIHSTGPFLPLWLPSVPWWMPNLTRMIILCQMSWHGIWTVCHLLGIMPGLIQTPNALNAKRTAAGDKTVKVPNNNF